MTSYVTRLLIFPILILPLFFNFAVAKQTAFRFDTPWMGVMLADISADELDDLDLDNGVRITKVYKESPADKAGLKRDDIIISFNGEKVNKPKDIKSSVENSKVNDKITLEYFRDGKTNSIEVKIEKRKPPQVFMQKAPKVLKKKFMGSKHSVFLGVQVQPLTDQLRGYFNVENDFGVLVSEVIKDSPAEKAGLKAGDVITKIAEREVKNYNDLIRGLNYFDPNDEVKIYYVRDKKATSVKVILGEPLDKFEHLNWFDEHDFLHDMEIELQDIDELDEEEIRMPMDELDKKIKIKKEVIIEDEA